LFLLASGVSPVQKRGVSVCKNTGKSRENWYIFVPILKPFCWTTQKSIKRDEGRFKGENESYCQNELAREGLALDGRERGQKQSAEASFPPRAGHALDGRDPLFVFLWGKYKGCDHIRCCKDKEAISAVVPGPQQVPRTPCRCRCRRRCCGFRSRRKGREGRSSCGLCSGYLLRRLPARGTDSSYRPALQ